MAITNRPITDVAPTSQAYHEVELAFELFNRELFDGCLPGCLITFQRKGSSTRGYYAAQRFSAVDGTIAGEIALNPRLFKHRPFAATMSTLVHEMCHHWQACFGMPSRGGYHNKEWAAKMCWLGLRPTRTGEREGPMTGQCMTHVILPDGRFEQALEKLRPMVPTLTWFDAEGAEVLPKGLAGSDVMPKPNLSGRRTVYRCPSCRLRMEGRSNAFVICGTCELQMLSEGLR